jgi:parallel beta-helix repeat protein
VPNITGQLEDFDGDQLTHGQLVVEFYGETSRPDGNDVRLGHEVYELKDLADPLTLDAGAYTFTVVSRRMNPSSNGRPSFETQKWSYDLVADTTWATIRAEGAPVPGAITGTAATLLAEMESIRDAQELIAGLTGEDAAVTTLAANPASQLGADLRSRFVGAVVLRGTGIDPTGATDSKAAIQTKVNAAAALGAKAVLPEGTYKMDSRLDLPTGAQVEGVGPSSVLHFTMTAVAGNLIQNTDFTGATGGNQNLRLRNLTIKGSGDGTPSGSGTVVSGMILRHCTDVEVTGCTFTRVEGVSVGWQGVARGRFTNNTVYEGGRGGFVCWGLGSVVRLEDIVCADNTFYKLGDDAMAVQANGPAVSAAAQPRRFTLTGNTVYGQSAVHADGAGRGVLVAGCSEVVIANNSITDTYAAGVLIQDDIEGDVWKADNVSISGNVIRDAGVAGGVQPKSGIYVTGGRQVLIDGNTVAESVESGILLSLDVSGFVISDNIVRDNGTVSASCGINLVGDATTLNVEQGVVSGNLVTGNAGHGIRSRYTNHVNIHDNVCLDNGDDTTAAASLRCGIMVDTTGTQSVCGNRCTDTRVTKTQTYGVRVAQVNASLMVSNNYLVGNLTNSLNLAATPTVLIKRGNYESATASANYDQDSSGAFHGSGTGAPSGAWPVGSTYRRTDGGAGTTFYVKESGGSTSAGWVGK